MQHYFDIYDDIFIKYKNKQINFLEIGVNAGGDLQMWKNYFTKIDTLYGIDINPNCKEIENFIENTQIIIGDQGDPVFSEKLSKMVKNLDIILDDGGHQFHQQINTFKYLFTPLNI